uniref:Uncharacterized protein n=1 Tax=viral metagenome TaxID=1070528 RepID=A0A6C0LRI5_9ZZZZ
MISFSSNKYLDINKNSILNIKKIEKFNTFKKRLIYTEYYTK